MSKTQKRKKKKMKTPHPSVLLHTSFSPVYTVKHHTSRKLVININYLEDVKKTVKTHMENMNN